MASGVVEVDTGEWVGTMEWDDTGIVGVLLKGNCRQTLKPELWTFSDVPFRTGGVDPRFDSGERAVRRDRVE